MLVRKLLLTAASTLAASCALAAPASATTTARVALRDDPLFTAVDANGGIYWRYLPYWADTQAIPGWGFYTGDTIELACWTFGGPAGPNNNTLWYIARNFSRSGAGEGYINDHYLNTPGTAAHPQPQGPQCDGQPVVAHP
ncbi:hypothetical protein ACFQ1S_03520 [Kibdelosporangium lantanae]|uniref:Secreted protein n=1 Tax=Kibdelosporangium lantanae TaxID=1497396 RepID=A0ABW3M400_9PSEU